MQHFTFPQSQHDMHRTHMLCTIIFMCGAYAVFVYCNEAYIRYYPSIPVYPNTRRELNRVKRMMSSRTPKNVQFFHLTNTSITAAFAPHVAEPERELRDVALSQNHWILFWKYIINRKRPWQYEGGEIRPIDTSTANTPSYPAGHAYQAYLLAQHLSKKYPSKKTLFMNIAKQCDVCRVKAGLHYPSDGRFARFLVERFHG